MGSSSQRVASRYLAASKIKKMVEALNSFIRSLDPQAKKVVLQTLKRFSSDVRKAGPTLIKQGMKILKDTFGNKIAKLLENIIKRMNPITFIQKGYSHFKNWIQNIIKKWFPSDKQASKIIFFGSAILVAAALIFIGFFLMHPLLGINAIIITMVGLDLTIDLIDPLYFEDI